MNQKFSSVTELAGDEISNEQLVRMHHRYSWALPYCKNKSDNVLFVKEKKIISNKPQNDHMVIGTFWFKKFKDFLYMHEKSVQNKKFINKELYIANNINIIIKKKK